MFSILSEKIIFFLILLSGIILRIYNINFDNLWYDEIIGLWVASPEHTFSQSFELHNRIEINTYAHHFILKIIYNLFGYELYFGRYLSVFFSILSILIIPYLIKVLKYHDVKNFVIFLISFNIYLISYSQEARVYSILFFFSLLSYLFFFKIFYQNKNYYDYFLFISTTLVAIFLHPFAIIILFSYCLFLLLRYFLYKEVFLRVNYSLLFILFTTFLFYFFYIYSLEFKGLNSRHYWISHPDLGFYTNFFFSKYFGSRLMGGIFLLSLLFLIFKEFRLFISLNPLTIFIFSIVLSYILPIAFGYIFKPVLISRYIIFVLIPIIILTSSLISRIKNKKIKLSFISFLVIITIANHFTEQTFQQFFKQRVPFKPEYEKAIKFISDSDFIKYSIKIHNMKSDQDSVDAIKNYITQINKGQKTQIIYTSLKEEKNLDRPFWFLCTQDINSRDCFLPNHLSNFEIIKEQDFNNINLKLIRIKS